MAGGGAFAELAVVLKTLFDSSGVDELVGKVKKASEEGGKDLDKLSSGEQFKAYFEGVAKSMTGVMAAIAVATKAVEFLGDAFHAALADEKLGRQLEQNMKALGGATAAEAKAVAAWVNQMEVASTVADDRLIPALTDLTAATGSVSAAQQLTAAAAGAAAQGIGDFESNVQIMNRAVQSGLPPSSKATGAFAVQLREAFKRTGDMGKALTEVSAKYKDGGAAVDDAGTKMERNKIQWEQAKEAVGKMLTTLVTDLAPAMKIAMMWISGIVGVLRLLVEGFKANIKLIGLMAQVFGDLATGHFAKARQHMVEGLTQIKESFVATFESVGENIEAATSAFDTFTGKLTTPTGAITVGPTKEQTAKALADTKAAEEERRRMAELNNQLISNSDRELAEGRIKLLTDWLEKAKAGSEEELRLRLELKQERERLGKMEEDAAKERADRQRETDELNLELTAQDDRELTEGKIKLLQVWLGQAKQGSVEELRLRKQLADEQKKLTTMNAADRKRVEDDVLRNYKQGSTAYYAAYAAMLRAQVKNSAKNTAERAALEKKLRMTEKLLNKARIQEGMQVARGIIGQASGVFGQKKEFAIADAVMNLYESITGIWAQWGAYPPVAAALTAVTSAISQQQIQGIQKQDITKGGGFDDPSNDMVAYLGGQRWARDHNEKFSAGVNAGMHEAY